MSTMFGASDLPNSGDCGICFEVKPLGFMDCHSAHWLCKECFLTMRQRSGTDYLTCPWCRTTDVTQFRFFVKTEEESEHSQVAVIFTQFNNH